MRGDLLAPPCRYWASVLSSLTYFTSTLPPLGSSVKPPAEFQRRLLPNLPRCRASNMFDWTSLISLGLARLGRTCASSVDVSLREFPSELVWNNQSSFCQMASGWEPIPLKTETIPSIRLDLYLFRT
ncbi:Hypothetical protein NTJ_01563 [Nesidiocoris tenuis]|uniref:Uncharacterized protein n=1 Tax=Nesidiocoris tenuis TaxID=355587 RepID=A0ABN7AD39_9HEMI|nr:Hypothetical protein NTJ_01563 [Nesidiocoris tenuis]